MISLRRAVPEDAPAIAAIERRSTPHAWSEATLASTLGAHATRAWVAVDEGVVVGHVIASAVAGTGEIVLVAVDPPWRRRGIAKLLLDRAVETWRAEGVADAWLEVRLDNAAAIPLYRSLGWRDAGRRRGYYHDGTDALLLRLDLGDSP
jgi:ribosomal-protein-alanine N-acetyltransferase